MTRTDTDQSYKDGYDTGVMHTKRYEHHVGIMTSLAWEDGYKAGMEETTRLDAEDIQMAFDRGVDWGSIAANSSLIPLCIILFVSTVTLTVYVTYTWFAR